MEHSTSDVYKKISAAILHNTSTPKESELFLTRESHNLVHTGFRLVKDFAQGFISHPESWWAALIQLLAYAGTFGSRQKNHAVIRQAIFDTLISAALRHPLRTGRLLYWMETVNLEETIATMSGRFLGGRLITNKIIYKTILNTTGAKGVTKAGVWTSQLIFVSYGQAMLSIAMGVRSMENIIFSMLTGSNHVLDGSLFKQLDDCNAEDRACYELYESIEPFLVSLNYQNREDPQKQLSLILGN